MVFPNGNGLCVPLSEVGGGTSRWSQRTGYPELALGGAPIRFERSFNVDDHVILSSLGPMGMACPLLDLRAHLGYR